jgi:hypothetical protein
VPLKALKWVLLLVVAGGGGGRGVVVSCATSGGVTAATRPERSRASGRERELEIGVRRRRSSGPVSCEEIRGLQSEIG